MIDQKIALSIKFLDSSLGMEDFIVETRYLIEDLRDINGMKQAHFINILDNIERNEILSGIRFEVDSRRLADVLKRLRDRLYFRPLETLFLIQIGDIRLQVETSKYGDLSGLMTAVQDRLLFYPESEYLTKAVTYYRTKSKLSPTEIDNLDLLGKEIGLSDRQAKALNLKAKGLYKVIEDGNDVEDSDDGDAYFQKIVEEEFARLKLMYESRSFSIPGIWPVLQELAENLGLSVLDTYVVYKAERQGYLEDTKLIDKEQLNKDAEVISSEDDAKAEAARQKQTQQAQEQPDRYRALCREVMTNDLYPSEFDQGRLSQAHRLRDIAIDEAIKIEAEVRDELYGSIASAAGVDYSRLRHYLHQQAWKEADLETEIAILAALKRDQQPLTTATVSHLPAIDLATLDGLWSRYSQGRFGFKAQQQVYRSQQQVQPDVQKQWRGFHRMLGWHDEPTWFYRGFKPYRNLTCNLEAPPGHLPTWRWCCASLSPRYSPRLELVESFMVHLNHCMPLEAATVPAPEQTPMKRELASAS